MAPKNIFTRGSRRAFLYLYNAWDDEGHMVMFLVLLRCLRRWLFNYFNYKILPSRFSAFRRAPFCIPVLHANLL